MTLLPSLAGDVAINGLLLNFVDEDGTSWWMTDLDGWWGVPDVDIPDEDRPAPFDGGYDLEGRYKQRLVTLSGGFQPSSAATAAKARTKLTTALRLVHASGLLIVQEDVAKQASVKLSGKPNIAVTSPSGTTVFEIGLKAADPRKLAAVQADIAVTIPVRIATAGVAAPLTPPVFLPTSFSSVTQILTNSGNYPADMIITFFGGAQRPTLINNTTGEFMRFDTTIGDGETLIISTDAHSALVNGQENRNYTISSDSAWFKLPPGSTEVEFQAYSASPSAWARIQFRSAWID